MPTLRALEILIAVADTGSISAAARSLRLTQPAVSHQLATLERETGAVLVDRGSRGALMTRRGRAVVDHARRAVAAADDAFSAARSSDAAEPIRVAVAESFTLPFFLPAAAEWNASGRAPLRFAETSSAAAAVAALLAGDHDLVVVPGPVSESGVQVVHLGTEHVVAVGPAAAVASVFGAEGDGRLPSEEVEMDSRARAELIGVDHSNGFAAWITDRCAERRISYRPVVTVRSVQNAAAVASAGFGVALVPSSALADGMRSTQLQPPLERAVLAVTRRERDPALDEFVVQLCDRVQHAVALTGPAASRTTV